MMRARTLRSSLLLACGLLLLALQPAASKEKPDNEGNERPALSGVWVQKGGELRIAFVDKNVVKICPHGDCDSFALVCEYSVDPAGRVKVKITGIEGNDEVKQRATQMHPPGTKFSFKWTVKDDAARLEDMKGEQVEHMKSRLEGEYTQKK